jgi:outer membrane lipoprotein-sorting protein/peroxiredoxin
MLTKKILAHLPVTIEIMVRLALILLPALLVAEASSDPDPRELVLHSAEALKKYKSYEIHSLSVIETRGGVNHSMQLPTSISVRRPDRMRIESQNEAAAMTVVSDGEHTWVYLEPPNKYIKRAASSSPESALGDTGILNNVPDITNHIESVKLTGEKTMEIEDGKFECWVVETRYGQISIPEQRMTITGAVQVSWISKTLGMTLQNSFQARLLIGSMAEPVEMTQATTTMALKLNPDLPDSLFVFTPPNGAKETADWTLPGLTKPDVVGKAAPAFRGKSLDGTDADFAAVRRKPVLMVFWTSWSGPSKRELAAVEKIHREFGAKGLTVFGVNVGEDKLAVDAFLKTTRLTYPVVLLDPTSEVQHELSISSYPTLVLIDKDGKVAAYEVGARGEAALRVELAKLGFPATAPPK